MRYLFSSWPDIERRLQEAPHWLLLFDYDGTLTPIRELPPQAKLSASTRQRLRRLATSNGSYVGIVSGRRIEDVRRLVALDPLIYVGNHGFEIQGSGWGFTYPTSRDRLTSLHRVIRIMTQEIRAYRAAWIENKKWTVSLHYRQVRGRALKGFEHLYSRKILPMLKKESLSVIRGKKVIEVRPYPDWNKGSAVQWIQKLMPNGTLPFFVGDDTTDEHVFRVLLGKGITVRIGRKRDSLATYYLNTQREANLLLERLVALSLLHKRHA